MARIRIAGIVVAAAGPTTDITAALTAAVATAGQNSQAVPLAESANIEAEGVPTNAAYNQVTIRNGADGDKIVDDATGDTVYGRVTLVGAVWTLSFFTLNSAGVETVWNAPVIGAGQSILSLAIEVPYLFELHKLPVDALIAITEKSVAPDPTGSGSPVFAELTTVADDAIPSLTLPIHPTHQVNIWYNGWKLPWASLAVDRSTGAVTYDPAVSGVNITTGNLLEVQYYKP